MPYESVPRLSRVFKTFPTFAPHNNTRHPRLCILNHTLIQLFLFLCHKKGFIRQLFSNIQLSLMASISFHLGFMWLALTKLQVLLDLRVSTLYIMVNLMISCMLEVYFTLILTQPFMVLFWSSFDLFLVLFQ